VKPPFSIVLIDDHVLLLQTLRERVQSEADMNVVAAARDAEEGVRQTLRLRPDVTVLDIDMPGLLSFEAARTIHEQCPETSTLFLSAYCQDPYIEQVLKVSARGYVTKDERPEVVIDAIRAVAHGGCFYSSRVMERLVVHKHGVALATPRHTRVENLTLREREVISYIAQGLSQQNIARIMHISIKTVGHHNASIMSKLRIHDRVGLALFAIREGLTEP
jgi:DNA-binding NarL/FixJ family response regulator